MSAKVLAFKPRKAAPAALLMAALWCIVECVRRAAASWEPHPLMFVLSDALAEIADIAAAVLDSVGPEDAA